MKETQQTVKESQSLTVTTNSVKKISGVVEKYPDVRINTPA